eukprot:TRINITY_DN94_c0_g1_i1.p1 TRINITY_DN94_c0_g1~~TRINITY_DN94_c0_g1_i1.p1  ORF type:complete len:135 (+),score=14.12 TRINITY_DN94_c0_g1_i1:76-480(+)
MTDSKEVKQQQNQAVTPTQKPSADTEMEAPNQFDYEECKSIIESAIKDVLESQVYNSKKVHDWTSAVVESILKSLQKVNKAFKYVVTCIIMQKNGAGLHTASTCFWDTNYDSSCSVRWDNKSLHALVTVFALRI